MKKEIRLFNIFCGLLIVLASFVMQSGQRRTSGTIIATDADNDFIFIVETDEDENPSLLLVSE